MVVAVQYGKGKYEAETGRKVAPRNICAISAPGRLWKDRKVVRHATICLRMAVEGKKNCTPYNDLPKWMQYATPIAAVFGLPAVRSFLLYGIMGKRPDYRNRNGGDRR